MISPPNAAAEDDFVLYDVHSLRIKHKQDVRDAWVLRFSNECDRLIKANVDVEAYSPSGHALFYLVGHRPPEEVARQHFSASRHFDDLERPAELKYQELAEDAGILEVEGKLTEEQLNFAYRVAELCASAVDQYRDPRDGSAGDYIRAMFCGLPF